MCVLACGEVSGVCGVCVGMAAILKKEQNVDSAARTQTQIHPHFHSPVPGGCFTVINTVTLFSVCMFYFNDQLQKTCTEMASRQEPREQGGG